MLKNQLKRMRQAGRLQSKEMLYAEEAVLHIQRKSWKNAPKWWLSSYSILARLAFVGIICDSLFKLTQIPVAVLYLSLGVLFCQVGFLERDSLQIANFFPFMMIIQMCNVPRMIASVTWNDFKAMLIPVFGMMILGALGLTVFGVAMGKFLRMPWRTSAAVSLCAMLGYPPTLLVAEGAVSTMDGTEIEQECARAYVLPKMLVGGFTTVSIISIFFASAVAPIIF